MSGFANEVRVTAPDGTTLTVPWNKVYHIKTSAVYESHTLAKRITEVKYAVDATGAGDVTLVVAQFNGANNLIEVGHTDHSGVFCCHASNRA